GHDLALQKSVFLAQLSIADEMDRPVSVHCLQAWGSLQECLIQSSFSGSFLLHSYGGPSEMVSSWVEMGAYFSISGYFFKKEKIGKLETFRTIPEDRLLLETDAPDMGFDDDSARYFHDEPGNHPGNLEVVYEAYAGWSRKSLIDVAAMCERNFSRFWNP
ncbi:MAG: TatD family hydrolase, partial [Verrucomicrobiota bacterium]